MARRLYVFAALDDAIVLYPVYTLLFLAHGVSPSAVSGLLAIWTITDLLAEVPSGVLADRISRRRLLAGAQVLRAVGFGVWVAVPNYASFAVGFVLWGVGGALTSGTAEALVYDELAGIGAVVSYVSVSGRAGTARLVGIAITTALATPVLAIGGYRLAGFLSVIACLSAGIVARRFPEAPRLVDERQPYLATLRAGIHDAARGHVARIVALLAVVVGVTGIEEYFAILARDDCAAVSAVPLLILLTVVGEAADSALGGRLASVRPAAIGALVGVAALTLAGGALSRQPAGLVVIAVAMGCLKLASVLLEAQLQARVRGDARATVLSVSALLAELVALAVVGGYALGSALGASSAVLVALSALPVATAAMLTTRALRGTTIDAVVDAESP